MKTNKYIIAFLALLFVSVSVYSQALTSSYFIDRSFQRSALNPAFSPESNYLSLPILSGTQVSIGSNFGIDNFVFNEDGTLYTYLNKNVPASAFCNKLTNDPTLALGANVKVLGLGFQIGEHGYLTFDADAIVNGNVAVPKELFYLTKLGMPADQSGNVYHLNNLDFFQLGYLQAGLAFKYDFSALVPGLSVGARLKYAFLADAVDVDVNQADLYMSENKWMIKTDAVATIATPMLTYDPQTKELKETGNYSLAGGGLLFDFGAEYKLSLDCGAFSGVNFAASISDIGKVTSTVDNLTTFVSSGEVEFKGMSDVNLDTDFNGNLEKLLEDFKTLGNYQTVTATDKYVYKFKPMVFASAEAVFFQNKLTAGAIYSNRYGFNELTWAINGKIKGFNASVTYNCITAKSFGFFLSFIPKSGVSIFIGSDCIPTRFTPQWIPINLNANVRFGLSIVFNHRDTQ